MSSVWILNLKWCTPLYISQFVYTLTHHHSEESHWCSASSSCLHCRHNNPSNSLIVRIKSRCDYPEPGFEGIKCNFFEKQILSKSFDISSFTPPVNEGLFGCCRVLVTCVCCFLFHLKEFWPWEEVFMFVASYLTTGDQFTVKNSDAVHMWSDLFLYK